MQKYIVKREHLGDREYRAGDVREADPISVSHLVANGVLALDAEDPEAAAPTESAPATKAAKKAPETK